MPSYIRYITANGPEGDLSYIRRLQIFHGKDVVQLHHNSELLTGLYVFQRLDLAFRFVEVDGVEDEIVAAAEVKAVSVDSRKRRRRQKEKHERLARRMEERRARQIVAHGWLALTHTEVIESVAKVLNG